MATQNEPALNDVRRHDAMVAWRRKKAPRRVAALGVLAVLVMLLFTPYVLDRGVYGRENVGYAPIWAPPKHRDIVCTVNVPILAIQLAGVVLICGGLLLYLHNRD